MVNQQTNPKQVWELLTSLLDHATILDREQSRFESCPVLISETEISQKIFLYLSLDTECLLHSLVVCF